ncbi:endonuclease domain-containing protein [Diaminobutyricibacter sp. McL0608]|uniref:endonuclease domain-containing protein n=1 Tax=Leifsonia sp. McL0608 TaxID=3143537 RepID=UPI0031F2E89E
MPRRNALPPGLQDRAFSVSEALSADVPESRLRASDLSTPFWGTRLPVSAQDGRLDRCRALSRRMGARYFFSHTTAAFLWGIPLPRRLENEGVEHVATIAPARALRRAGVRGHKLTISPTLVVERDGFQLAAPEETWSELASMLSIDDLAVAADGLIRRKRPLSSVHALLSAAAEMAGRAGAGRARKALELAHPGTDSPMESRLRLALRRAGLPLPEVNGIVSDTFGGFVALCDLVFREHRVVVEYDGSHHRIIEEQYDRDIDRHWMLDELGWRTIRINRSHMANGAAIAVARVRAALRAHASGNFR